MSSMYSLAIGCFCIVTVAGTEIGDLGQRGNWRKKHEQYQEATQLVSDMEPFIERIKEKRPQFEQLQYDLLTLLDDFYTEQVITRENVAAMRASLTSYFEAQEAILRAQETLNDEGIVLEESQQIQDLGKLRLRTLDFLRDLEELAVFEQRIEAFMHTLEEVLGTAGSAQQESEQLLDRIALIIDHVRAQSLLDEIETKQTLVEELHEYIDGPYATSFGALEMLLKKRLDYLRNEIEVLEDFDLFIRNREARIADEKAAQETRMAAIAAEVAQREWAKLPWYTRLWQSLRSFFF